MKSSFPSWFIVSLTLTMLTLVACNGEQPAATATSGAEETAVVEPSATSTSAPTATLPPTSTPEPTATAVPTDIPAPETSATFETAACQFNVPPTLNVECGYLTVPEDRTQPDNDRTIRLHVAIFASRSSSPQPDPIIYFEGGPGANALFSVPFIFEDRFGPFLEERNFIMFDQRGTGYSEPQLDCPEVRELGFELLDDDLTVEEANALQLEAINACRARLVADGVNLSAFDSVQSAADVNDLRLALGIEQWNLYGISYGTRLAQTVMRDYPMGIRSVVLDSVYPLAANLTTETPANLDRALDALFAACVSSTSCETAYPALEARFFALVEQLNQSPIQLGVSNFFTGEQYEALINGDALISVYFQALYSEALIPVLPDLIAQLEAGETTELGLLLSNFISNSEFFTQGMQWAVQCQEEVSFSTVEETETAVSNYPEYGDLFRGISVTGTGAFPLCEAWDVEAAPANENEPIRSNIPTLLMSGEFDPITPPSWATLVAENLDNRFNYVFPSVGHGSSVADACPTDIALQFIGDPLTEPQISCIAEMEPPQFVEDAAAAAAEIVLVPFVDETFGIEGVAPEGWESVLPGTNARQSSGLDQTLIVQQAVPGLSANVLLGLISEQLGLENELESLETVEAGGKSWARYESELQGQAVDMALAEDDQGAYLILLVSEPDERETLVMQVLLPALEALAFR